MTYVVVGVLGTLSLAITTVALSKVRMAQRRRDELEKDDSGDVCVALWPCVCPFAAVQSLRQEGLQHHTYELSSSNGGETAVKLMAVVPV